jgi:hypothetical protein
MQATLEREYVDYVRASMTWLRQSAYRLCGWPWHRELAPVRHCELDPLIGGFCR